MIFGSYIKLGALAVVIAVGVAAGFYKLKADRLSAELAQEQQARALAQETVNSLTAQRNRDLAALGSLRTELSQSRSAMRSAIEQLEELKRNEQMVQADPAGVERLINDRLQRMFVDLACASGDTRDDCTNPAGETGAAEPTEP